MKLSPFVYWAQTESTVSLKVDLKNVKDTDISLIENRLEFKGTGVGAQGSNRYEFILDFYSDFDPEKSNFKVLESKVDFSLVKITPAWWPRLTCQPQKQQWLKIDFDRWKSEEDFDDEEKRDVMKDYPDMYKKLHKEEYGYIREDLKKVYLVVYNLFQFIMFGYILIVMGIRYYRDGPDSMAGTYDAVGGVLKFCQLLQFLEVLHPLFGYTKGGVLTPFIQVTGRTFIIFCMIDVEKRMHEKPVVFYLFFLWSLIEVIRYPYYITQLNKKEIGFLTWLRYTIWIPLYPLGILCEGIVVLRNVPYFEETNRFTISLPNAWNFAFHMPTFMRLYLLILIIPGTYFLMTHMYRARVQKLGPKSWKKKENKSR